MASSHLIPVASGLTPSGILSTGVPAASAFPALLGPVFFQPTVTPLRGGAGGEGGGGGSGGGQPVSGQSAIYATERYENYEKRLLSFDNFHPHGRRLRDFEELQG